MADNYSMTRETYEEAGPINERLEKLRNTTIYDIDKNYYDNEVMDYFNNKCATSKALHEEAEKYIPGGVQHNLAFNKPFPICIQKAEGAFMWDKDGNRYYDFLQAGGPTILGSNYPAVKDAVRELIETCGPVTGLFHEAELMLAREIHNQMPACEKFRMLGSGTESVMAAIRISRCYTHNKRVIKIGGGYHGWSDQMVYGLKIPGSRFFLESHGIPNGCFGTTDEVKPNDLNMLEKMLKKNKLKGGTACVIVEPVGPESGTRPVDFDYNTKALELAHKYGALFVFDEVVTGFRVGLHGAQGFFNVKPDLTIFGKIIAGGYPAAGGVGGRADLINLMAAGVAGMAKKAYVGGTLAANPLSAYAGYCTIKEIEKTNACEKAGKAGDRLKAGLQQLIDKYELPFVAYNQGSIVHLECTGAMSYDFSSMHILSSVIPMLKKEPIMLSRKDVMERMGAAYMANGIITLAGSRLYTSMADTDEIIDGALERFDNVFKHVVDTGLTVTPERAKKK